MNPGERQPHSVTLGLWFVLTYFGVAIAATWAYFLNPEAATDQGLDGLILRVGAAMTILPLVWLAYKSYHAYPGRIVALDKDLPILKYVPLIAGVTLVMGIVNHNSTSFALGDTYRIFTLFLGVVAGLSLPLAALVRVVLITSILYNALFVAGMAYAQSIGNNVFVGMGTFHLLIPLCMLPAMASTATLRRALVILLALIALILGLKRSTLLIFPVLLLLLAFSDRSIRKISVAIAVCAAIGLTIWGEDIQPLVSVYNRVAETYEDGKIDSSLGSRVQEVLSAWNHLNKESALGAVQIALLGLGSGATYPMDSDDLRLNTIADDSTDIHNIHFTPMTLVFRHGIIPAALILLAYGACLFYTWRKQRRGSAPEVRTGAQCIFLLGLTLILISLSGFTIVGDLLFPLMVGALVGAARDSRVRGMRAAAATPTPISEQRGIHG
jgi:hypothetical protein